MNQKKSIPEKNVKMQILARNLALSLKKQAPEEFGEPVFYTKVYFGKCGGEILTIESHIDGEFCKYINNNGAIILQDGSETALKAKTFAHYTYEKSEKNVDGTGCAMCRLHIYWS